MLGDRRSNSIFAAPPATAPVETKPEQTEVHDISFEKIPEGLFLRKPRSPPRRAMSSLLPRPRGYPSRRFSVRYSPTSPVPMPP